MTFEYWLKKYIKNDKAVCDLLTDYYFVCRMEKAKGRKKPKLTLNHLEEFGACDDAIATYNRARNLYANDISSTCGKRT